MINIATKLTFLVAFLICATTASAQFNYEKKFKDGVEKMYELDNKEMKTKLITKQD